jgi:hypothetical protein
MQARSTLRTLTSRHGARVLAVIGVGQLVYLILQPATLNTAGFLARNAFTDRYLKFALAAPFLLLFGIVVNNVAKTLDWRWLEWSPLGLRSNIALRPLSGRWWLPYALLLGACMPVLALIEEVIFRSPVHNWLQGLLWGALAFGAFHLTSFVSIRMAIYLSFVGVLLVRVYLSHGLAAAFVMHATYNLVALTVIIVEHHLDHSPRVFRRATARLSTDI